MFISQKAPKLILQKSWQNPHRPSVYVPTPITICRSLWTHVSAQTRRKGMLIIIENSAMATFLSVVLTYTRAPQEIIIFFTDFGVIPMMFWLMLAVICLILGTFIEIIPLFYLTVPIFAAIAISVHVDLLQLFVVFTGFAGIGMLTPPVCVGVYTTAGVLNLSPDKAFRGIPLFVVVGIIYGALMVMLPSLATWLPQQLFFSVP